MILGFGLGWLGKSSFGSDWPIDDTLGSATEPANAQKTVEVLPRLRCTEAVSEELPLPATVKIPLKTLLYGSWRGDWKNPVNELVAETFSAGRRHLRRYRFESSRNLGYIFDPIAMPDGERIVFKYGSADVELDGYTLFLFNRRTAQVKAIGTRSLRNPDVQISTDGRYVSYIRGGGAKGPLPGESSLTQLWIYDTKTGTGCRVAQSDDFHNSVYGTTTHRDGQYKPELFYSLNSDKLNKNQGSVQLPDLFLFDPQSRKSRLRAPNVNIMRPSPDGQSVLFCGPAALNKDYSSSLDNFALRLKKLGGLSAETVALPPKLRDSSNIWIPIVYSYWTPDSRRILSVDRQYRKDEKLKPEGNFRATWDLIPINVTGNGIGAISRLTSLSQSSYRDQPEGVLFCFAGSTPQKLLSSQAVIATKGYLSQVLRRGPEWDRNARTYTLHLVDLKTGAVQELLTLPNVNGIGGLDFAGKPCCSLGY